MVSGQRLPGPRGQPDAPLQTGAVHSRHLVLACPDPRTFLLSVSLLDLIYLPNLLGFFLGLISSFFLLTYFWLCWGFAAALTFSVCSKWRLLSLQCAGFSLQRVLLLQRMGSRVHGLVVVV